MTDGVTCPKCGAACAGLAACAKCGLLVDKMADYTARAEADATPTVRAAWDALIGTWEEQARHDAFLVLVTADQAWAWAAGRYRTKAIAGDEIAKRQLAQMTKAAESVLRATATPPGKPRSGKAYSTAIGFLIMLVLMAGLAMVYMLVIRNQTR